MKKKADRSNKARPGESQSQKYFFVKIRSVAWFNGNILYRPFLSQRYSALQLSTIPVLLFEQAPSQHFSSAQETRTQDNARADAGHSIQIVLEPLKIIRNLFLPFAALSQLASWSVSVRHHMATPMWTSMHC